MRSEEHIRIAVSWELIAITLPCLSVVVKANLRYRKCVAKAGANMFDCKGLSIVEQELMDQVVCKITDALASNPFTDEAKLFKMAPLRYRLFAKRTENLSEVFIERRCEPRSQPPPLIPLAGKAEPVLLDFREDVPRTQEMRIEVARL